MGARTLHQILKGIKMNFLVKKEQEAKDWKVITLNLNSWWLLLVFSFFSLMGVMSVIGVFVFLTLTENIAALLS